MKNAGDNANLNTDSRFYAGVKVKRLGPYQREENDTLCFFLLWLQALHAENQQQ